MRTLKDKSRVCQNPACGRTFDYGAHPRRKFCSEACYHVARRKHALERPCLRCGTAFVNKRANVKYCSEACRMASWTVKSHGRTPPESQRWAHRLLDDGPDAPALVGPWLGRLPFHQLDAVWLPLVVEQFGEGQRAALAEALQIVRKAYRASMPVSLKVTA